jgi:hypothetical protein
MLARISPLMHCDEKYDKPGKRTQKERAQRVNGQRGTVVERVRQTATSGDAAGDVRFSVRIEFWTRESCSWLSSSERTYERTHLV